MNITLSIDDQVVQRARDRLRATGKSLNQEIRDHLRRVAGDDNIENDIEFLRSSAGLGNSSDWKWNRDELYEDRIK